MINLKDIKIRKFMSKSDVNILISSYIELMDAMALRERGVSPPDRAGN